MAWPWRKAVSLVLGAMLISASLATMPISPAQALEPTTESSCLIINAQHELVSADFCTGDVVIPASVTTIKSGAFTNFKGAVSFESNSQLQTVEQLAFYGGGEVKSIIFPPTLSNMGEFAVAATGNKVLYFEAKPTTMNPNALWSGGNVKIVQPRGDQRIASSFQTMDFEVPFQIDCNTFDGGKDFIGLNYVALELHNCLDPRNPGGANPPARMGYILNKNLNESVALQSLDGLHRGMVRLRQLGDSGMRLAASQEISGAGFSMSALGDQYDLPANSMLTCSLASGTPLPIGVVLTSDCKLEAASTTSMASSTTDITINWVAHPGPNNAFDMSQNPTTPSDELLNSGSVGVRLSLRKMSQLTAAQLFQMKLATAQYSGTTRDWNLAVDAYRALPADQVPAGSPDAGILAATAVEQFEAGAVTEGEATSAVDAFGNQAAPQSTFLASLRSRVELMSVKNSVTRFEAGGANAKYVRQRILALPSSEERTALLGRFANRANVLFQQTSAVVGGVRTVVFSNPYQVERFTVPVGVTQLSVEIFGAEGSQGGEDSGFGRPNRSGFKGRIQGTISVSGGQELTVGVGEAAGDAPSSCLGGSNRIALDRRVALGGINPLGGYSGGNGGSPGVDGCSGYGGAGGAASVLQIGDSGNPVSLANLVAGGSAGSSGSSDQYQGQIGLATASARADVASTNGQSALSLWRYTFSAFADLPSDGGAVGGAGGGSLGGTIGVYDLYQFCGLRDYCPTASSPGSNSTSGILTLAATYVPYTFAEGQNANGRITISYVEPPVTSNPGGGTGGSGGGTASPTPTSTGTPTSGATTSDAPGDIKVVPVWKGADVSWKAPTKDGGTPITSYEVNASTGQICQTDKLTCRLTGLKPGQLLQLTVKAKNAVGFSAPTQLQGAKVFIPLSLNLWQLRPISTGLSSNLSNPITLKPKLLNPAQLRTLRTMLVQDTGGFTLTVRLARNASKLSMDKMRTLLVDETKALRTQLRAAGLLGKVKIQSAVMPPDSKAKQPSVILVVRKP